MMRPALRIAPLLLALLLSGCASIPLGTMWKLSGMGWQDVAFADTREVRAAILVPDNVSLDPGSASLNARLLKDESEELLVASGSGLALREKGARVITPLPAAPKGRHWFVFSLDDEGQRSFSRFQQVLAEEKTADRDVSFHFNVAAKFTRPDDMKTMGMSLWLKLADDDDWFELIDDAEVEFGTHREITD